MNALIERLRSGEARAIAQAISIIERGASEAGVLLAGVRGQIGRAYRVGITGPPGSGKSTLVSQLIGELRRRGRSVGVLAVDPSSPVSGGALLGDRVRMQEHADDSSVFVRSMASRGHRGGVSSATEGAVTVLDAAGFDVVLVETIGVGQDEVDIAQVADVILATLVPGTGDDIQLLKAGLMEIADIFVVNKSDLPGADRLTADVAGMLALDESPERGAWKPSVIRVSAIRGEGVADLVDALDRFRATLSPEVRRSGRERTVSGAPESTPRAIRREQPVDMNLRTVVLDHVAVAVSEPAPLSAVLQNLFDVPLSTVEILESQGVVVAFADTGAARVEILAPSRTGSPLDTFLARRGAGLHHIALRVADLETELARLKMRGVRLIDERPRAGADRSRVAFLHPSATCGVLIELVEKSRDD